MSSYLQLIFTRTYVSTVNDGFVSLLPTCEFFVNSQRNTTVLSEVQHIKAVEKAYKAYTVFTVEQRAAIGMEM